MRPSKKAVSDFLREYEGEAFSIRQLCCELPQYKYNTIKSRLGDLCREEEGFFKEKVSSGRTYYWYANETSMSEGKLLFLAGLAISVSCVILYFLLKSL